MELARYWSDRTGIEYEAIQLNEQNSREVAEYFELEHVKEYLTEDGTVEEVLFRPGDANPVSIGMFVVRTINNSLPAYIVYAGDFDFYFKEIKVHAYVPQMFYSSNLNYVIPCVFCGKARDEVPYHRDPIPGETLKLPDGGTLRIDHQN